MTQSTVERSDNTLALGERNLVERDTMWHPSSGVPTLPTYQTAA